jgi:hypothetical protein
MPNAANYPLLVIRYRNAMSVRFFLHRVGVKIMVMVHLIELAN